MLKEDVYTRILLNMGKHKALIDKILSGQSDANIGFIIYWSDDDQAFIAETPELPGCMAHGETHNLALKNIKEAMQLWLKTAREFGDPIPRPKGRRLVFA